MVPVNTIYADQSDGGAGSGQRGLSFNAETGALHYEAVNKKASSGIRYVSTGWVIRKDRVCNSTNPLTAQCSIKQGGAGKYLEISSSMFSKQPDKDLGDGTVLTVYDMTESTIRKKLKEGGFGDIKAETPLFFSAVFQVSINGNLQSTKYYDLASIRSAQPWADKSGFRQYYDQKVTFYGFAPLKVKLIDHKTGQLLETSDKTLYKVENKNRDDGNWPIGSPSGMGTIKYPEVYTTAAGKAFKLKCSFETDLEDNPPYSEVNCGNAKKTIPDLLLDGSHTGRLPQIKMGGTWIVAVYEAQDDITCRCNSTLTIPNSASIGGEVAGATIGKSVPIELNVKQLDEVQKEWKTALTGVTNVKMKVDVQRTGGSGSPTLTPAAGTEQTITTQQLLDYFSGKTPLKYTDNLSSYPLAEGAKVTFKYNAVVTVTYTVKGKTYTVVCDNGKETEISFFRKKVLDPSKNGWYTSRPSYWSEIKEGSPYNETFEAMAGTPTTRSLYYAAGGSELCCKHPFQFRHLPSICNCACLASLN